MKTKASKQPKQLIPVVRLRDIKPRSNPSGGAEAQRSRVTSLAITFGTVVT